MPRTPTVEVNGYAGHRIRVLLNFEVADVAAKMGVSANYLYQIESGLKTRVGTKVFRAWMDALLVDDRRALMCNPHTQAWPEENGNGKGGKAA